MPRSFLSNLHGHSRPLLVVGIGVRPDDQGIGVGLGIDDHVVRVNHKIIVVDFPSVSEVLLCTWSDVFSLLWILTCVGCGQRNADHGRSQYDQEGALHRGHSIGAFFQSLNRCVSGDKELEFEE